MRDFLFGDARRFFEGLLNDRASVPDDAPARPLEIIQKERPRLVDTRFGRVVLRRRYYYHTKARSGRCPLDHALDLVRAHPPGLARIVCRASTHSGSFDEAAQSIHACLGLKLVGRNFRRLIAEAVPVLREAQGSLPAAVGEPIPTLYVASDGTGVPLRRGELAGVKGRQPDGTARTREAKLGCVFTPTCADEEGNPVRDPDSTTYVGTFEDCREHGTHLRAEAVRRGYAIAQRTVYLGDGAAWIWENARINFPDAVQTLDFYHASEHVGELAAALLGAGPEAKAQQSRWCHEMKESNSDPSSPKRERNSKNAVRLSPPSNTKPSNGKSPTSKPMPSERATGAFASKATSSAVAWWKRAAKRSSGNGSNNPGCFGVTEAEMTCSPSAV